jgi:hypothetical protein
VKERNEGGLPPAMVLPPTLNPLIIDSVHLPTGPQLLKIRGYVPTVDQRDAIVGMNPQFGGVPSNRGISIDARRIPKEKPRYAGLLNERRRG